MNRVENGFAVLLADDDENDVFLIRRTFRRISGGAHLFVVPDGGTVLAYLQGEGQYADRATWPMPRILVLNEWMPNLSGMEVLCWVRSQLRFVSLPVVLLGATFSPSQVGALAKLRSAACTKAVESKLMAEAFERAMSLALTLAWDQPETHHPDLVLAGGVAPALTQRTECVCARFR